MIEMENTLVDTLDDRGIVDGHDMGTGQMNIFVHTDTPDQAFGRIKDVLNDEEIWTEARVAYRELLGSEYTVIWPKGLKNFEVA